MKLIIIVFLVLLSLPAFAGKYSGCEDPQYKAYVAKRLAFYEKLDKERYDKALNKLDDSPFESMGGQKKASF